MESITYIIIGMCLVLGAILIAIIYFIISMIFKNRTQVVIICDDGTLKFKTFKHIDDKNIDGKTIKIFFTYSSCLI